MNINLKLGHPKKRKAVKSMKYSFKCSCGDVMTVDAENREEAVRKLQEMMTEEKIPAHMSEKHPGEPVPSKEQVNQMIEEGTVEGDLSVQTQEDKPMEASAPDTAGADQPSAQAAGEASEENQGQNA